MSIHQSDDGDRRDLKGGRDGQLFELVHAKGQRGREYQQNPHESVLGRLHFRKDGKPLISKAEMEAGLKYHAMLRKATPQCSVPEYGRIPGQSDIDGDVKQVEAAIWLEKTNSKLPRRFVTILTLALHPWSHNTLEEIDATMGYQKGKQQGRAVLVEALMELSEILGFADTKKKNAKYG